ncbi:MAG TPA: hypothetical protein VGT41_05935 [Candidatus Babeliales bacterium]|nr:hypothetical protein [Candidatus Babeliales bacterium]
MPQKVIPAPAPARPAAKPAAKPIVKPSPVQQAPKPQPIPTTPPIEPGHIQQFEAQECADISSATIEAFKNELIQKKSVTIPLSNIIESYVSGENLLNSMQSTNPTRHKMVLKWIRNAATRVFHTSARSVLEIVVNGFDSMLANQAYSIGKFGMGFFSILSFLSDAETNGAKIIIQTCTKTTSGLFAYSITLQQSPQNNITATFDILSPETLNSVPGTIIRIVPNKPFTTDLLQEIRDYMHYLDFYQYGILHLTTETNAQPIQEIIGQPTIKNPAHVYTTLSKKSITTSDTGSGICFDAALTKLLVPSSSSKGKSPAEPAQEQKIIPARLVEFKGNRIPNVSYFLISINGLISVKLALKQCIYDHNRQCKDLLITMPQRTQLTIARNEVYIAPTGVSFEQTYLQQVIQNSIEELITLAKENDPAKNPLLLAQQALVAALYTGFKNWEEQTAAQQINGLFTGYIKTAVTELLETNDNIIPVHSDYYMIIYNFIQFITKTYAPNNPPNQVLLPLEPLLVSYNYFLLERFLKEYSITSLNEFYSGKPHLSPIDSVRKNLIYDGIQGQLIAGKQVFFLPDELLTHPGQKYARIQDLGLFKSLFVPVSLVQETIKKGGANAAYQNYQSVLSQAIISRYTITMLTPAQQPVQPEAIPQTILLSDPTASAKMPGISLQTPIFNEQTDNAVASAFLKKYADLLINKFRIPNSYNHVIVCYTPSCMKEKNLENGVSRIDNNTFLVYLPLAALTDMSHLAQYMREILSGIVELCDGSREKNPNFIKQKYTLDEIPKTLSVKFANTIFIDQKGYYRVTLSDEELLPNKPFIQMFFKMTQQPGWNNLSFAQQINLIQTNLTTFLSQNKKLVPLSPVNILNTILSALIRQAQLSDNQYVFDTIIKKKIWPLPAKKDLSYVENLFFSLLDKKKNFIGKESDLPFEKSFLVSYKGLSEKLAQQVALEKQDFIATTMNLQQTVAKTVEDANLPQPLIELLLLYLQVNDMASLPPAEKKIFIDTTNSLISMYKDHLHIQDNDISYSYGSSSASKAIQAQPDVDAADIIRFIEFIRRDRLLYNKLLDFQIADFIFKTDKMKTAQDLMNKVIYIPSILSNTPLSLLALLLKEQIDGTYIKTILKEARNPAELSFICHTIVNEAPKSTFKTYKDEVANALTFTMAHFIREKIEPERINDIYNTNRTTPTLKERTEFISKEPISTLITSYLEQTTAQVGGALREKQQFLPAAAQHVKPQSFTLKQLINAHCQQAGLEELFEATQKHALCSLDALVQKITSQDIEVAFDKIEQAIEAGSEKSPITATITESLQNSVDVIKAFVADVMQGAPHYKKSYEARTSRYSEEQVLHEASQIQFQVASITTASQVKQLELSIRDFIGFPSLKSLMTDFLIPDFSNKNPELGNIGDMGNGLFKIYQQADAVFVITRLLDSPNKTYALVIKPMRNPQTGRVQDLTITAQDISHAIAGSNKRFFGTTIKILFRKESIEKLHTDFLYIKDYLYNCVGATNIELPNNNRIVVKLKENNQLTELNPPTTFLFKYDKSVEKTECTITKRHDPLYQSYITTGGVPFRSLASFAKQIKLLPPDIITQLSYGYIINLPTGFYEPVQSRTQLQIPPENVSILKEKLLNAYYFIGLTEGRSNINFFKKVFTHFGSKVDNFTQLALAKHDSDLFQKKLSDFYHHKPGSTFDIPSFFTYFKPSDLHHAALPSFYDQIQYGYQTLVPQIDANKQRAKQAAEQWNAKNTKKIASVFDENISYSDKEQLKKQLLDDLDAVMQQYNVISMRIFNAWKAEFEHKIAHTDTIETLLVHNAVIPWFEQKRIDIEAKIDFSADETAQARKGENVRPIYAPHTIRIAYAIMHHSLSSYCNTFMHLIGSKQKIAVALEYDNSSNSLGSYHPITKTVTLNLAHISMTRYFVFLIKLLHGDMTAIKNDPIYKYLFDSAAGIDAVITHELEHARRNSDHEQAGSHSPATDANGNQSNFRACANSYSQKAQEEGLLEIWSEGVRSFLQRKLPKSDVKSFIQDLQKELPYFNIQETERKKAVFNALQQPI